MTNRFVCDRVFSDYGDRPTTTMATGAGVGCVSTKPFGDVSLFGHHHSAPTFASRALDVWTAILHLPLAFWLTVIPISGGLAIAYLTHRLNLSRDRLAFRREGARRRDVEERAAARVRADLTFRLSRHREALRVASRGDLTRFESEHDALLRRCAEPDVIDLFGKRYPAFMALLQREEVTLSKLRACEPNHSAAIDELRRTLEELGPAFESYVELVSCAERPQTAKTLR